MFGRYGNAGNSGSGGGGGGVAYDDTALKAEIQELENKGVIFIEDISEVPDDGVLIFSAHGIPPKVQQEADDRNIKTIDATCPLVTKVHKEAEHFDRSGYTIILIGHKGHQEVIGTMGYAQMTLVEVEEDVAELTIPQNTEKIVYLSQTTLSIDDTADIIKALRNRYPNIKSVPKGDICYASQNRQNAVKELAKHVECVLVVGALNSSNSNRLVETAKKRGVDAFLIHDLENIDDNVYKSYKHIGITSGASVPDSLVKKLTNYINNNYNVEIKNLIVEEENMFFPVPKEVAINK
jgi:4-hydroxy-3-methylbut-2-enyl diphosphate reductase